MASTNKTSNYKLPQWVGSDHPTWKGDLNDAFTKIDTTLKTNETNNEKTSTIVTALSEQVGTNRSSIESVNSTLSTVSQESASALQMAKNAATSVSDTDKKVATLNDAVNSVKSSVANNSSRLDLLEENSGSSSVIDVNQFKQMCLDYLYPIGTIYLTVSNSNPGTLLGGSWQKISSGYYIRTVTAQAGLNSGKSYYDFTITQNNSPFTTTSTEAAGYGLSQVEGFKNRVAVAKNGTPQRISVPLTPLSIDVYAWRRVG